MLRPLSVLFVDENRDSMAPLVDQLRLSGFEPLNFEIVTSSRALKTRIWAEPWDVVVGGTNLSKDSQSEILAELHGRDSRPPYLTITPNEEDLPHKMTRSNKEESIASCRAERLGEAIVRVVNKDDPPAEKQPEEGSELDHKVRQSQKMEAVGQLAAGVAHDFNNLLTAMIGFADLAENATDPDELKDAVRGIRRAVDQASGVTKALLTFSRKNSTDKASVNLGKLVSNSIWMLRQIIPAAIDTISDVNTSSETCVLADETQIQQVIMNLAVNARDAMPEGGRLLISVHPNRSQGMVNVVIEDDGIGMSEEVQARLYDPFFTTKARGYGTGLGLSVVHGIVNSHDGRIRVQSEKGIGTRVQLSFPMCRDPEATEAVIEPPRDIHGRGRSVLIAEDNPLVQDVIAGSLRRRRFDVIRTSDGRSVVGEVEKLRDDLALVVLDIDLPGKSGASSLEEIRKFDKTLPIVVVTGSPTFELPPREDPMTRLLRKPFDMESLLQAIGRLI